jgi:hypothetical protein
MPAKILFPFKVFIFLIIQCNLLGMHNCQFRIHIFGIKINSYCVQTYTDCHGVAVVKSAGRCVAEPFGTGVIRAGEVAAG